MGSQNGRADKDTGGDAVDRRVIDVLRTVEREGHAGLLDEVVGNFRNDAPCRMAALLAAAGSVNGASVAERAAELRESAFAVGANPLMVLCSQIERLARVGAISSAAALAALLPGEVARVGVALESLLLSAA